jgi:hypothetical protein
MLVYELCTDYSAKKLTLSCIGEKDCVPKNVSTTNYCFSYFSDINKAKSDYRYCMNYSAFAGFSFQDKT